jgi:hypothetical protein
MRTHLKDCFKSPFPALNVHHSNEPFATNTVYSDTPAVDSGAISAQLCVGYDTLLADVYGMKTDEQFVERLEDQIRQRGAPDRLISDRAQVEISRKVVDILRAYCIVNWHSEPHKQHQNPAERRYQVMKTMANTIMDRTGTPAYTWLLCMMYVCFILNFSVSASLNFETPMKLATGSTPNISALLCFVFMEPVYSQAQEPGFPSKSREKRGYFVGIAEHVGHAMTFKILTDNTKRVINHSNIRSTKDPKSSTCVWILLLGRYHPLSSNRATILLMRRPSPIHRSFTLLI